MVNYDDLSVRPIINACGTVTRLGGAPLRQEALAAYEQASLEAVPIEELQTAVSQQLASWIGCEAGIVTSGAAAALTLGAAAILWDVSKWNVCLTLKKCPATLSSHGIIEADTTMPSGPAAHLKEVGLNEVVSGAGVRRTSKEYEAAIDDNCGILYVYTGHSAPALDEIVAPGKRYNLPILVDAAGELPPQTSRNSSKRCQSNCF